MEESPYKEYDPLLKCEGCGRPASPQRPLQAGRTDGTDMEHYYCKGCAGFPW